MVQVHGDRMCGSFSSTVFNHRTDEYGGSAENRARFAVEAVSAVHAAVPGMPIDYKLAVRQEEPHYGNAGVLVEELFSEEGVGTMVHTDSYREIRPLKEEDIPELLSMIARSVVDSKLVNRNYEDIAARIDSYYVLTLDDSIVGCVAVYPYPEHHSAELGCLYIKHRHEGRGYGRALCEFAKRKAEEMGMEFIFALSQSAVHYFRDRMHYAEFSRDSLPPERLRTLKLSGRKSGVFGLRLK